MQTVAPYMPEHFNSLPSFSEAQNNFRQHSGSLDKLGDVIGRHGMAESLGLALLHRHFDLMKDEVLVESISPERAESVGQPFPVGNAGSVLPHLFRVSRNEDGSLSWMPLEFARVSDDDADFRERYAAFASNGILLDEFAGALEREEAVDAIGIALFHGREDIHCEPDEILNESTDEVQRKLVMRPSKRSAIGNDATPTLWRFDGKHALMACTCQDGPNGHMHASSN